MKLMIWLRDISIKRKLMLIGLLTSGLALLSFSLILVVRDWVEWRDQSITDMTTYANIIGTNVSPALMFNDQNAAQETLAALAANPDIVDAIIYDKEGRAFARFIVPRHSASTFDPSITPGSYVFNLNQLAVTEPVRFKGEVVGSIYLESDLSGFYADILRDTALTFTAALGVFLASIFLFARLQKTIVNPILDLSDGMRKVSTAQDYAVRVAVHGKDEIGVLARTFNDMLKDIQHRDDELVRHREHLEEVVAQRTAKLQESEERFRNAFQNSAIGMALVGLDGHWLKVNNSLCQIIGYPEQELLSKTFQDITHPDDLQTDLDFVAQLLAGSMDHYQMGKRYFHKDGHTVWIRLSVSLIRDAQGIPLHFVAQIEDITGQRLAEENIRKLIEELEIKVQERTRQLLDAQEELVRKEKLAVLGQVAGSVGHELRNPLGVMSNAVYFLQTVLVDADETTREYLDIIKDEIAGSERIVSDLLDSVRTQPPHPEAVGVRELIDQTLRKCGVPASVTVTLEIPATISSLRVDAQQIHQVMRNLISNGIEAMPEGGTLEISAVEDMQAKTTTINVRDSGIGMTPEQLGKLFQPLFTTKARGIGLGLVVVKNLTEANGGTVKVESEAGKGSVFTVTLPAADV